MEKINAIEVGNRLQEIRIKNDMSQPQMAKMLNYSISYYNLIENGKVMSLNSPSIIEKISKSLNVDYEWLAYGKKSIEIPIYQEPISLNINIPLILKVIRFENNISQRKMASILGYSNTYYNTIEKGTAISLKNTRILRELSEKIKKVFDIDINSYKYQDSKTLLAYNQGYEDAKKDIYEELKKVLKGTTND